MEEVVGNLKPWYMSSNTVSEFMEIEIRVWSLAGWTSAGEGHGCRVQSAGDHSHPVEKCREGPETKQRGPEVHLCQVWKCRGQVFPGLWGTSSTSICLYFDFQSFFHVKLSLFCCSRMSDVPLFSYSWPHLCPQLPFQRSGELFSLCLHLILLYSLLF